MLTNLILQDVEAGRGAVVIDPKGDLVTDVLERLPIKAAERVTLLDPAHPEVLPALDVLAGEDENLVVDNIVGIFRRIFEANWGPRTDDVMRAACLTLTRSKLERPSLARVPLLLTDNAYRSRLTKNIGDPAGLGGFWASYEAMSDSQRSQVVGPLMNKLRSFLMREFVRTAIGPGSRPLDFGRVLDRGLLLVRVPKGTLGDDTAKLIGSLVVAKVWQAALARANRQQSGRTDASLYVDECQNFLNLPRSFDEMLAEARGYGLSLVLAHQHLGQLGRELRDAISANARNKVYFSVSPEDARQLARHVGPELSEHDLSHLGSYQVALRPVVAGREERACTFKTRPSRPPSRTDKRAVLDVLKADAQADSCSADNSAIPLADWVRTHVVEGRVSATSPPTNRATTHEWSGSVCRYGQVNAYFSPTSDESDSRGCFSFLRVLIPRGWMRPYCAEL